MCYECWTTGRLVMYVGRQVDGICMLYDFFEKPMYLNNKIHVSFCRFFFVFMVIVCSIF